MLGISFVAPKRSISGLSACFFKPIQYGFSLPTEPIMKDAHYSTSFRAPPSEIAGTAPSKFSGRIIWTIRRASPRSLPCLRINIKREPTAGMPHQFLHNLHVLAVRDQKRGARMSKRVPSDSLIDTG
jgi:hypothetical protein